MPDEPQAEQGREGSGLRTIVIALAAVFGLALLFIPASLAGSYIGNRHRAATAYERERNIEAPPTPPGGEQKASEKADGGER